MCNHEYVVVVSCKKDDEKLSFETDPTVVPNTMYVVGRVVQPNTDCKGDPNAYARFRWDFAPLWVIPGGVSMKGVGVGQRCVPPGPQHVVALRELNAVLAGVYLFLLTFV